MEEIIIKDGDNNFTISEMEEAFTKSDYTWLIDKGIVLGLMEKVKEQHELIVMYREIVINLIKHSNKELEKPINT